MEIREDLFEIVGSKPLEGRTPPGPGGELQAMESTYQTLDQRQRRMRDWPYWALCAGVANLAFGLAGGPSARRPAFFAETFRA